MKNVRVVPLLLVFMAISACVTINVYFPAAAAEAAADRIIKDVYGEQVPAPEAAPAEPEPSSHYPSQQPALAWLGVTLTAMVPAAEAAAVDIDVTSPGIQRLKAAMAQRHKKLAAHYGSGAVGMTAAGEIAVRDLKAVPLRDRQRLQQWVAAENNDRRALYKEIARANSHPEWESDIRSTFARRWVGNAPGGWWHQDGRGTWKRK